MPRCIRCLKCFRTWFKGFFKLIWKFITLVFCFRCLKCFNAFRCKKTRCCRCCIWCEGHYTRYQYWDNEDIERGPSCWPCAATGLYIKIPTKRNPNSLRLDAEQLHGAMAGIGTKESDLIRVLASRTPEQLDVIRKIFFETYGKEKQTLEKWIKDDTSGDFNDVLLAMARDPAERDARQLNEAMRRLGTNDDELIDIITTRSHGELEKIKQKYLELYGRTLAQDISGDTSGRYEHTLLACINRADNLAERIHKALKHPLGTDDDRVVRILTGLPRDLSILRELVEEIDDPLNLGLNEQLRHELSMPDLQDLKKIYRNKYGKSLSSDIKEDTSWNYQKICLTLLKEPDDADARTIHEAVDRPGTNDNMLIELVTGRSNRQLAKIGKKYKELFGKSMQEDIRDDTSFNYRKALHRLVTPRYIAIADILKESFRGLGTEDDRLMCALTGRSRYEIAMIAKAYRAKYNHHLIEDIRSETSFWYKRALVYIVLQGTEHVMNIKPQQLLRIQDM